MGTYQLSRIILQTLRLKLSQNPYNFNVVSTPSRRSLGNSVRIVYKPNVYEDAETEKCGRKHAAMKLSELLGVRQYLALDLATKHKKLWEVPGAKMEENYRICKSHGIEDKTLIQSPDILHQANLEEKLEVIKQLKQDLNVTAAFSTLSLQELGRLIGSEEKICDLTYRTAIIKQLLEVPPEIIYESLAKRSFLRTIKLDRFEQTVNILKKNGVTNDEIVKDWWILKYSPVTIEQRINVAKANNVEKIKTWMVRGQAGIFETYVKRRSENKEILGDNTLVEYLSERLECTVDQAKSLIFRLPAIKNKSMKRIQKIIDFLYTEGFKPQHICRVPKILLHSVETTRRRIRELEKQGLQIESLHMLTKSQKQYMQYYESLVKSNKSKVKVKNKLNV